MMFNRSTFNAFFRRNPLLLIGVVVYSYALASMVLFQYVLLPATAPSVRNGLFSGDPQYYNQLASAMAQQITTKGWGAWSLRPAGQGSAGVAAVIYAVFSSKSWLIILLNALLHSLAAVTLISVVRQLIPLKLAVIASLFFIISPYQMHWLSQINKDSYSILGFYLFVLGWVYVFKDMRKGTTSSYWWGLSLVAAGAVLISIVRPYMLQLLQVPNIFIVCLLAIAYVRSCVVDRSVSLFAGAKFLGPVLVLLLVLVPLSKGGASGHTISKCERDFVTVSQNPHVPIRWINTNWVPDFLERRLFAIITQRSNYDVLGTNVYGPATRELLIDNARIFRSVYDVAAYLPRAMQIALFSPFPDSWTILGKKKTMSMFRRFVTFEMVLAYISFVFLVIGCFLFWNRIEFILPLIYSLFLMLIYGLSTPHISVLYRYRYAPFMLLVTIGFSVGFKLWEERKNMGKKIMSPS
jgi:hypothetical protein